MNLLNLLSEAKVEKTIDDIKNFSETLSGSGNMPMHHDVFDMPIEVDDSEKSWETLDSPERLVKIYDFEDAKEVLYFFNELYKYQFKINHHCKIIVDNLKVTVEAFTHDY